MVLKKLGRTVDAVEEFKGTVLIVAPHMDDEVLACGGTLAILPQKDDLHVIYATDGMKSPAPILPWQDSISDDLGRNRMQESIVALGVLGVPDSNAHFLGLPEANLRHYIPQLRKQLLELIERIAPDHIFLPFRYDRHPDHLAVNHVISEASKTGVFPQVRLFEYFVYYRWRLLTDKDIRSYVNPRYLVNVETKEVATRKRMALDCFESQTTIYYPWQTRPILTSALLDEEASNPELFLCHDPAVPGTNVFTRAKTWIRLVHRLEPFLQKWKYLSGAALKRGFGYRERSSS